MGIMTRMLRLCKADVHGVMDQLEDKGLLLKQYLREMETSLGHKEQQVGALAQNIGRLTGQVASHVKEMEKLEHDLTLALEKEKDDIARMLIRRRRALESTSGLLEEQLEKMTQEKVQMSKTLASQRLQYETLKAKADIHCHRATDRLLETDMPHRAATNYSVDPSDAEIELELIKRKESLQKGGTP